MLSLPLHSCVGCLHVPSMGFLTWASPFFASCHCSHPGLILSKQSRPMNHFSGSSVCLVGVHAPCPFLLYCGFFWHHPPPQTPASQGVTHRHVVWLFCALPSSTSIKTAMSYSSFNFPHGGIQVLFNMVSPGPSWQSFLNFKGDKSEVRGS